MVTDVKCRDGSWERTYQRKQTYRRKRITKRLGSYIREDFHLSYVALGVGARNSDVPHLCLSPLVRPSRFLSSLTRIMRATAAVMLR